MIDHGQLTLRTRERSPYGLAALDERVGIGGYDDGAGLIRVFVDTDSLSAASGPNGSTHRSRRIPLRSTAGRVGEICGPSLLTVVNRDKGSYRLRVRVVSSLSERDRPSGILERNGPYRTTSTNVSRGGRRKHAAVPH